MASSPLLETMRSYMQELDYDLLGLSVRSVRSQFAHVYYIWRTLREAVGPNKALDVYAAIWDSLNEVAFAGAVAALGIKEVKDIATLGRVIERVLSGIPCLYEPVKNTKDVHVGHIPWCANPAYGPSDNILNRLDYYRQEVIVTVDPCLRGLVNEAKKMGLEEDIEIDVPAGRCRDGNASFCEFILRRKGSPKVEATVLADSEKRFVEFEMAGKEPLLFILEKQGRTLEEQGPASFLSFFVVDMFAYDTFEKELGREKALDMYKKLWLVYPVEWVKEARLELEIGRAVQLNEIAKIIAFCQKKKYIPYQIARQGDRQMALTTGKDPFVEMSTKFCGKQIGSNYLRAVASVDRAFINKVVTEIKMADVVKATVQKALAKGDDTSEIVIEAK